MISENHYGWSQIWLADDFYKFRLQSDTQNMRVTVSTYEQALMRLGASIHRRIYHEIHHEIYCKFCMNKSGE